MTSMMTDEDILLLLDFDANESCEADDGCSNGQDWSIETKCCGMNMLICNMHYVNFKRQAELILAEAKGNCTCPYCFESSGFKHFSEWIDARRI